MVRTRDIVTVGGIILILMAVADWRFRHPGPSQWLDHDVNDHLGAEYDEIARAIRSGRGFSDPFREPSGPTAWMAPVLPYLLAGLYWATNDDREFVVEIVLLLKYLALLLTGLMVVRESRRLRRACLGHVVFTVGLVVQFHGMFQRTHDEWLLLLVVACTWLGIVRWWSGPGSWLTSALWGAFGGFAALCSPVAGATWALLTAARWLPRVLAGSHGLRGRLRAGTPLMLAALCSIAVVMPWMLRNRLVLGDWIPIKSNCVYEIWQSQCLDDDGVVDSKAFAFHPWQGAGAEREKYIAAGELEFIASKWPEVRQSVRADPWGILGRVTHRFLAATVWYPLSPHEQQQVEWIVLLKRAIFVLPFAGILLVLHLRRRPLEKEFLAATFLYASFLAPYVMISYYERYALPLLGVKAMLVTYAVDTLIRTAAARFRRAGGEPSGRT
jgi:hypothetical protein